MAPGVIYPDGSAATAEDLMFIRTMIENLVTYGYTNYRLLLVREDGQAVFQVPRGSHSAVRFDEEVFRWVADIQPDATGMMTTGFDLDAPDEQFSTIVLAAPLETRPDGVVARAYRDAEHLELLKDNLVKRDNHSKPWSRCCLVRSRPLTLDIPQIRIRPSLPLSTTTRSRRAAEPVARVSRRWSDPPFDSDG